MLFFTKVALEAHPYHVDSLLTFSDIYKLQEDLKMARELVGKHEIFFFVILLFHLFFYLSRALFILLGKIFSLLLQHDQRNIATAI